MLITIIDLGKKITKKYCLLLNFSLVFKKKKKALILSFLG